MTRALRHALHVEELDVKRSWLVIVTCLWSASTAVAQDIERVEVRGNHRVDAETIRAAVATKTGQPLDPQRLRSDLRAIWKLGMFSDVRAVSDGGALVFEVVERPAIRKVLVAGNHELALDKIDEVIELKRDAAVDEVAIRRSRDKIAELCVAQGFAFAAVDSALLPADGGAVDVKFTVDEHARVTVSDIVFTGNRAIESGELRKHMSTSPPGALSFLTGAVLGGISDIRGYQPRSLGPHLWSQHAGDVGQPLDPLAIGGNLQLVGNVELEFPLMKSIGLSGVAFFDIGNAYNLESRFCSQPGSDACTTGLDAIGGLRKSVGLGVRWRSPLGPLRFEWGIPLDLKRGEKPDGLEFSIGTSF